MLTNAKAYSGIATLSMDQARRFYGETLQLDTSEEYGLMWLHLAGGRDTLVYEQPDANPATFTILNFEVDDIDAAVDALAERGVRFERYEGMEQDARGSSAAKGHTSPGSGTPQATFCPFSRNAQPSSRYAGSQGPHQLIDQHRECSYLDSAATIMLATSITSIRTASRRPTSHEGQRALQVPVNGDLRDAPWPPRTLRSVGKWPSAGSRRWPPPGRSSCPPTVVTFLERQRAVLIDVATGTAIQALNDEYTANRRNLAPALAGLRLEDPFPCRDLWAWYGSYREDYPRGSHRWRWGRGPGDPVTGQAGRTSLTADASQKPVRPAGTNPGHTTSGAAPPATGCQESLRASAPTSLRVLARLRRPWTADRRGGPARPRNEAGASLPTSSRMPDHLCQGNPAGPAAGQRGGSVLTEPTSRTVRARAARSRRFRRTDRCRTSCRSAPRCWRAPGRRVSPSLYMS
jgi:hypothetical protein